MVDGEYEIRCDCQRGSLLALAYRMPDSETNWCVNAVTRRGKRDLETGKRTTTAAVDGSDRWRSRALRCPSCKKQTVLSVQELRRRLDVAQMYRRRYVRI